MKPDRNRLIRLAHERPALRPSLLPLIQKMSAMKARIDMDVEPVSGMVLVIQGPGEPFEGNRPGMSEMLYWIETDDGLGEGSLIIQGTSLALDSGDRVRVESSNARKHGRDYVGEVAVRKL